MKNAPVSRPFRMSFSLLAKVYIFVQNIAGQTCKKETPMGWKSEDGKYSTRERFLLKLWGVETLQEIEAILFDIHTRWKVQPGRQRLTERETFLITKRLEDFWDSYEEIIKIFEIIFPEDMVFSRRYFMFPTEIACQLAKSKDECLVALNHYRRISAQESIKDTSWEEQSLEQEIEFWEKINISLRRFDPPPRKQASVVRHL